MYKRLIEKLKALRQYIVSGSCDHSFYRYGIRYEKNLFRCTHCGKEKNNYR